MAITKSGAVIAVNWGGAPVFNDVAAGATPETSDIEAISDTAIGLKMRLTANNQGGAPVAGDILEFYIAYAIDAVNFATSTDQTADFLAAIDCSTAGDKTVHVTIDHLPKNFRIVCINRAAANAIRATCKYIEQLG